MEVHNKNHQTNITIVPAKDGHNARNSRLSGDGSVDRYECFCHNKEIGIIAAKNLIVAFI